MFSHRRLGLVDWFLRTQQTGQQQKRKARNNTLITEALESRCVLSSAPAAAVLDVPLNGSHIINGTQTTAYPSVGLVGDNTGNFGSGVLIGSRYVLTAGHVTAGVANTNGRFTLGNQVYTTSRIFNHPQYSPNVFGTDMANDIAIMELSAAVPGVTPSTIYRSAPTVGQVLTLVGFGGGGTGTTGSNGDFGIKRVGTTPIDSVTTSLIHWNFDNNTEANTAPGDSGGPAFVTVGGQSYVAGITSGGTLANAGIGDQSFDTRVDVYASWIDSIVTGTTPPPPTTDDHSNNLDSTATLVTLASNGTATATGNLEVAGDRDVFRFSVTSGGSVTISQTGTNGLDTYLRVYNSSGTLVAENDDSGGTLNSSLTAMLTAGQYYISAGSYNDQGTGGYQVNVAFTATVTDDHSNNLDSTATPITLSSSGAGSANGQLEVVGDRDVFRFTVSSPGSVTVQQTATGSLDTYLRLFNSSGTLVAENDDASATTLNSLLTATLTPGTYYVSAGSYLDQGTGGYQVSVAFAAVAPATTDYYFSIAEDTTLTSSNGTRITVDDSDIIKLSVVSATNYTYSIYFDGSDVGLTTTSEDIDAFSILSDGRILISTVGSFAVPGITGTGNDVLVFTPTSIGDNTAGSWAVSFRGATYGLNTSAGNVDAISLLPDGSTVISIAGAQTIGGAAYRGEDLLKLMPNGQLSFYFDGSDVGLTTSTENVDAAFVDSTGVIHLSTNGNFVVPGLSGTKSDVFRFTPTTTGANTAGTYSSTLDVRASSYGLTNVNIDGFQTGVTTVTPQPPPPPPPSNGFNITVRFTDSTLSATQQAVFQQAAGRWAQIITGDIPDVVVDGIAVDDIVIDASGPTIDGPGGILGQAGPTSLRSGSFLPSRAVMEFDSADLARLQASGDLLAVILHEMGHCLGIGTIWRNLGLVQNVGAAIHFTGASAVAEYNTIFGTTGNFVPVEAGGGPGTAGGHWDEATFDNELMTGYLNGGTQNPISRVTVGALRDMGYQVNLNAADAYSRPATTRKATTYVYGGHSHEHHHERDADTDTGAASLIAARASDESRSTSLEAYVPQSASANEHRDVTDVRADSTKKSTNDLSTSLASRPSTATSTRSIDLVWSDLHDVLSRM